MNLETKILKEQNSDPFVVDLFPSQIEQFGFFMLSWVFQTEDIRAVLNELEELLNEIEISKERFYKVAEYAWEKMLIALNYKFIFQRPNKFTQELRKIVEEMRPEFQVVTNLVKRREIIETCSLQLLLHFDSQKQWLPNLLKKLAIKVKDQSIFSSIASHFFRTIFVVLNDEISFFNFVKLHLARALKEETKFNSILYKIESKVMINFLHCFGKLTFDVIENSVKNIIDFKKPMCLNELTFLDKTTNTLGLRSMYKNKQINPNIFYPFSLFDQEFRAFLESNPIKASDYDPILGSLPLENFNPLLQPIFDLEFFLQSLVLAQNISQICQQDIAEFVPFCYWQLYLIEILPQKDKRKLLDHNIESGLKLKECLKDVIKSLDGIKGEVEALQNRFANLLSTTYTENNQQLELEASMQTEDSALSEEQKKKNEILERQRKIKEKFQLRQGKFISDEEGKVKEESKSNVETMKDIVNEQSQQVIAQAADVCSFCKDDLNSTKHKGYGLLAYIRQSNYLSYCLAKNRKYSKSSNEFGTALAVNCCSHMVHADCYEKIRNSRNRYQELISTQCEFTCIVCAYVANIFLPVRNLNTYEYSYDPKATFQLNLQELEKHLRFSNNKSFKTNQESVALTQANIFLTELMLTQFDYSPDIVDEQGNIHFDIIQEIFLCIIESVIKADLTGLDLFVEKKAATLTSLISIILTNAQIDFVRETFESAFDHLKSNYLQAKESVETSKNCAASSTQILFMELIFSAFLLHRGCEDETMPNFKQLFLELALFGLSLEYCRASFRYLRIKASFSENINKFDTFKDFKAFYSDETLINEDPSLSSYLRKIICFGLLFGIFEEGKVLKLGQTATDMTKYIFDLEDMKNFNELFGEFIAKNSEHFKHLITDITLTTDIKISSDKLIYEEQGIISLPKTFQGVMDRAQKLKCRICQTNPKVEKVACVICGVLLCTNPCNSNITNPDDPLADNLVRHAYEAHSQASAYLICETSQIVLVNGGRMYPTRYLYTGQFGQKVSSRSSDCSDFQLSPETFSYLKNILVLETIPQEISNCIRSQILY